MSRAPIVAVTSTTQVIHGVLRVRVNDAYVRALEGAGLVPLIVPPLGDPAMAGRVLEAVDGLVLTGGEDVEPVHYGADPHQKLGEVNARRDASELALAAAARARRLPTLAICRGVQVLNVALGGTLVQDIPSELSVGGHDGHADGEHRDSRVHRIDVAAGSLLAAALGATSLDVNSFHHQAIDRLGAPLRITARAPDGVIEGVEADDAWWAVGVQWHPEELAASEEPWDRALFAAFAREASRAERRA